MTGASPWLKWMWPLFSGLVFLVLALSDPFGWHERRLEQSRAEAEQGRLEARYRQAERQAQSEIASRQAEYQKQHKALSGITETAVAQAKEQPDAKTALGEDRVRRLREHDIGLCGRSAGLAGCPATVGYAR